MRLTCGPWPLRAFAVPVVLFWGEAITARNFQRGVKRRGVSPNAGTGAFAIVIIDHRALTVASATFRHIRDT